MDRDDAVRLGLAGAALAAVFYAGWKLLPQGAMQSRYQLPTAGLPSNVNETPSGFMDARDYTGGAVILPHRYPQVAGQEITTLIQYGMAPLFRPRPQDFDWYASPPSEMVAL